MYTHRYNGSNNFNIPDQEINVSNSSSYFFVTPYIFEMGRSSGNVTITYTVNASDIFVYLYVFNNSVDAITHNIGSSSSSCLKAIVANDPLIYTYNSTMDICGTKNSYFGPNRYFLVQISRAEGLDLTNVWFNPWIQVSTYGTLNTTALSTTDWHNCSSSGQTSIQCDVSYGWFFMEIGKDNVLFVTTQNTNEIDLHNKDYNTILSVTSQEWLAADMFLFFVLIILILVLVVGISYIRWKNVPAWLTNCECGGCGRWMWTRTVKGYHFLAGTEKDQELEQGVLNGVQN